MANLKLEIHSPAPPESCIARLVELARRRSWPLALDGTAFRIRAQSRRDGSFTPVLAGTVVPTATGSHLSGRVSMVTIAPLVVLLQFAAGAGLLGIGGVRLVSALRGGADAFDVALSAVFTGLGLVQVVLSPVLYWLGMRGARRYAVELVDAVREGCA